MLAIMLPQRFKEIITSIYSQIPKKVSFMLAIQPTLLKKSRYFWPFFGFFFLCCCHELLDLPQQISNARTIKAPEFYTLGLLPHSEKPAAPTILTQEFTVKNFIWGNFPLPLFLGSVSHTIHARAWFLVGLAKQL